MYGAKNEVICGYSRAVKIHAVPRLPANIEFALFSLCQSRYAVCRLDAIMIYSISGVQAINKVGYRALTSVIILLCSYRISLIAYRNRIAFIGGLCRSALAIQSVLILCQSRFGKCGLA
jgi:hypothetical protein